MVPSREVWFRFIVFRYGAVKGTVMTAPPCSFVILKEQSNPAGEAVELREWQVARHGSGVLANLCGVGDLVTVGIENANADTLQESVYF